MRTYVRRAVCAGVMAGGFTVLGLALATSPASAEDQPGSTSGQNGLLSGNQTGAGVQAPVHVSGNQVTVVGDGNTGSSSGSGAGSGTGSPGPSAGTTDGSNGSGSGNQSTLGADAPVDVSGNQVTVDGDHNSGTSGGSTGSQTQQDAPFSGTSGQSATGSGNQSAVQVGVPITACGNQVTVIGDSNENTGCADGSAGSPGSGNASGAPTTSGQDGTVSGNQTNPAADAPVTANGNQVTVIGNGNTSQGPSGDTSTGANGGTGGTTDGSNGNGSGNQTNPAADAPVTANGNQVTVIGNGNTARSATQAGPGEDSAGGSAGTPGTGQTSSSGGAGDPGTGAGTGTGTGTGTEGGSQAAAILATGSLPQQARARAGRLAATGAPSGLLLWLALGLLLFGAGLVLTLGQRGRLVPPNETGGEPSTDPSPTHPVTGVPSVPLAEPAPLAA